MEDILRKLVALPTTTGDQQAAYEALSYIAEFVTARGMHVQWFQTNGVEPEGFTSLVATINPGHKTPKVLLAAHIDVVPATDAMFTLRKAESKLYGRGVLDMKFAIAAYLQVIDELSKDLSDYDLGLMITTDEEVGGQDGTAMLVKEGYLPQVCILPDGGDNWQIQTHAKGFLTLKIAAYGTPAHGSRPWLGDNAVLKLIDVIGKIQMLFPESEYTTNTLNVGTFTGGSAHNQVPAYAESLLDIRLINELEKDKILQQITTICGKYDGSITVDVQTDGVSCDFNLEDPLLKPFAKLITEVTGIHVKGSHTPGTSDARFFAAQNVPCISLYPTGGNHHGPDEWLDEQAFYDFKEVLARYLQQIAKR